MSVSPLYQIKIVSTIQSNDIQTQTMENWPDHLDTKALNLLYWMPLLHHLGFGLSLHGA